MLEPIWWGWVEVSRVHYVNHHERKKSIFTLTLHAYELFVGLTHTDCAPKFDGRLFFRVSSAHTLIKRFVSIFCMTINYSSMPNLNDVRKLSVSQIGQISKTIFHLFFWFHARSSCVTASSTVVCIIKFTFGQFSLFGVCSAMLEKGDVDDEKKYRFLINIGRKLVVGHTRDHINLSQVNVR